TPIEVMARYLYGATAPDLSIEADAIIRPTWSLAGFPGYSFGRRDDTAETTREPLGNVGVTDESGEGVAEIVLPDTQATTRPQEAGRCGARASASASSRSLPMPAGWARAKRRSSRS